MRSKSLLSSLSAGMCVSAPRCRHNGDVQQARLSGIEQLVLRDARKHQHHVDVRACHTLAAIMPLLQPCRALTFGITTLSPAGYPPDTSVLLSACSEETQRRKAGPLQRWKPERLQRC